MTMLESAPATVTPPSGRPIPSGDVREQLSVWGRRIDAAFDFLGDRLNPILVKEARQSMKSKQFSVTFSLVLFISWIWTAIFIAFSVPDLYFAEWGIYLLYGYVVIISIPLFIVVPFAAFRSLAAETEDGTFELLSITSLNARQIITGKLGSAVLQMIVFYSALAPSITFTYLLKGVDIVTIGLLLGHSFFVSVFLSVVGLGAATVTRSRQWQILVSVVLVAGLLFLTFMLDMSCFAFFSEGRGILPSQEPGFWIVNAGIVNLLLAFGALSLLIGAGQITFASENRSTRVRWMLLAMQAMWIGWMVFLWRWVPEVVSEAFLWAMVYFAAIFWMIAGSFLSGEVAQLSPRARRELPQSLLGRILLTWLNPGSGSGYTFALVNLAAVVLVQFIAFVRAYATGDRAPTNDSWLFASITAWGYVAAYMGFVRILVSLARKYVPINIFAAFLVQVVFCVMGIMVPFVMLAVSTAGDPTGWFYSELQLPNWAWTLYGLTWPSRASTITWEVPAVIFGVGFVVFLVNLFDVAYEVEEVRTLAPQRVLEDDQSQRPAVRRKKNPWDEETAAADVPLARK